MTHVIVIGAGLFGSVITKHLTMLGFSVKVIDSGEPTAGSRAAGCVIKPSWLTHFGGNLETCMALLRAYYRLLPVTFYIHPSGFTTSCQRIEPAEILAVDHIRGRVIAIERHSTYVVVTTADGGIHTAEWVIVAAGIWSPKLTDCDVTGKYGWSFRGPPVAQPIIDTWAPYRQVVAFNMNDGRSWVGDGTALLEKSATPSKREAAITRCEAKTGVIGLQPTLGARPYVNVSAPCLVKADRRVITATGGAKSGTVGAAWAALEVAKIIQQ
jgi:glycine/D-amino acid oxidase-like deaminating enzyme